MVWKIIKNKVIEFTFTDFSKYSAPSELGPGNSNATLFKCKSFSSLSTFLCHKQAQTTFLNMDTLESYTKSLIGIYFMF